MINQGFSAKPIYPGINTRDVIAGEILSLERLSAEAGEHSDRTNRWG